jgi:DNA-binding transcriptional MerR regulator
MGPMLVISELANLVGVTVRTIRHYHRLGLLPEPERRGNGYRSYGPADLIRLSRIRRMQDTGLSLAEIGRLLDEHTSDDARETGTRTALLALDEELAAQQRELHRRREAIAAVLAGPADLTLPPELTAALDRLAVAGFPAQVLAVERDSIALLVALHPEQIPALTRMYRDVLDGDQVLITLGGRFAAMTDLAADDPAVDDLATELIAALRRHVPPGGPGEGLPAVVDAFLAENLSPAQRRCADLIGKAFG